MARGGSTGIRTISPEVGVMQLTTSGEGLEHEHHLPNPPFVLLFFPRDYAQIQHQDSEEKGKGESN
jgi:hypothetical protein